MKPLLFLFLTGILCACTLSEQADMEINPKPTLVVEYRYTDTNGNNTTHEEIGHTVSLLFDPIGDVSAGNNRFGERFTDSITLLSGVPTGEYTVVTFANADGMERPVLTPGVSGITELLCKGKTRGPTVPPSVFPRSHALYRTVGPAAGAPDRTLQEIFPYRAERNRRR